MLYISQLEIDNFKSFGRKTLIPFFEGFTIISGPNGSGKSNIIDSILFVLALSTSRNLRAEKLTDLINLNTGRNTAEVTITFSDGTTIKRRIKQTRNAYYNYLFLNGKSCRQGDLLEFLAAHGIVPHGYNVVMQGDINRIIEMSDLDRRKVIDEIAGVAEFDAKKQLAHEELNIVRGKIDLETALLEEQKLRLAKLAKERESALTYSSWKDKLDYFGKCLHAAEVSDKVHAIRDLEETIEKEAQNLQKHKDDLAWAEHERDFLRGDIATIDREIQEKSGSDYMVLLNRIAEAKASITQAERSILRYNEEKEAHERQLNETYTAIKRYEEKITELSGKLRELSIDRTNLAMGLSAVEKESNNLEKEILKERQDFEVDEKRLSNIRDAISGKKEARSELLSQQNLFIEQSRTRSAEKDRLETRFVTLQKNVADFEHECSEYKDVLNKKLSAKKDLDGIITSYDTDLYIKRDTAESLHREIRTLQFEIQKIEAQYHAQGRHGKALEAVLKMDGVYGTIADLGRCRPEYANALNTAAGGRLFYVVVRDDTVASDAIRYLQEYNLGRVTFLPLNKLRSPVNPPLSDPDIIAYAIDLLDFKIEFVDAFRVVFGGTVVIDTLLHARRKMGQYRIVTSDGSLLEKSGSMTGGSTKKEVKGFGAVLGDDLTQMTIRLKNRTEEEECVLEAIGEISRAREKAHQERMQLEQDIIRTQAMFDESLRQQNALHTEVQSVQIELEGYNAITMNGALELAKVEDGVDVLNKEIEEMNLEIKGIHRRLEETGIPQLLDLIDEKRILKAESERRLKNKDQEISDNNMEKQFSERNCDDKKARMEEIKRQNERIDAEIVCAEKEIVDMKHEIGCIERLKAQQSQEIADLQEKRDTLVEQIDEYEKKITEHSRRCDRILITIETLSARKDEMNAELLILEGENDLVEVTLTRDEILSGMKEADETLAKIGPVNLCAIEEYDLVQKLASDREEKLSVLSHELESIRDRIESFTRMKYEAFIKAYHGINDNFREVFARLTSGSGELKLDNQEDPFAGGLSFAVQPRDKKVHLLSALSGGEKSLTTLAFIFSIQKHIPAPFYAFDEVDMNLDGSNVERIADMIRELASSSQFINISLRKPMIDAADRIIGVTIRPDKSTLVTGIIADAPTDN